MNYRKLAYDALQRVSVSTTWTEGAIQRVSDYLEITLQKTAHNSDCTKCPSCGSKAKGFKWLF